MADRVLLLGGARSGKSTAAERMLAEVPDVVYVATGHPAGDDPEWAERVALHQARRPASWRTVETIDLVPLLRADGPPLLVDCLTLWLSRTMDAADVWSDPARVAEVEQRIDELAAAWADSSRNVVAVSNEVGSGVVPATESGRLFRDLMGRLNTAIAAASDQVLLSVAGRILPLQPNPPAGAVEQPDVRRSREPSRELFGRKGVGGWSDGLRLAVGMLTVVPAGVPVRVDRQAAGRAMVLAPVAALVIGAAAAGVLALVELARPDAGLLAAVLAVAAVVGMSAALHLDGLADTADGLGSRRDRQSMLRIMRQGDVGPFGVTAVVLVLLVDVAALTACVTGGTGWQSVLVAVAASRLTLPWACRAGIQAARPEGLGALVAGTVRLGPALTISLLTAVGSVVLLVSSGTGAAIAAAGSVVAAAGTGSCVVSAARRKLGGITGDVLGCAVELGFAAALIVLALTG